MMDDLQVRSIENKNKAVLNYFRKKDNNIGMGQIQSTVLHFISTLHSYFT